MSPASTCIPAALVAHNHLLSLANLQPHTSMQLQLQLVLLPPGAADMSEDMPLSQCQVLEMPATVTKYCNDGQVQCQLSGRQLCESVPVQERWWQRGEPVSAAAGTATVLHKFCLHCFSQLLDARTLPQYRCSCSTLCRKRKSAGCQSEPSRRQEVEGVMMCCGGQPSTVLEAVL
jgi:hypothetical protein